MALKIVKTDITKLNVDAIVNITQSQLNVTQELNLAIDIAAGIDLSIAREELGIIKPGKALLSSGYNLLAKYIIYATAPALHDASLNIDNYLRQMYKAILEVALANNLNSVAIPIISSELFKLANSYLDITIKIINELLKTHKLEIYIVIYDEVKFDIPAKLLSKISSYLNKYEEKINKYNEIEIAEFNYIALSKSVNKQTNRLLKDLEDNLGDTFIEALFKKIDERGFDDVYVYKKANIDRRLFSKLRNSDNYNPSKKTALSLCLALELNLDDTKDLIGRAGHALSNSNKFDLIIEVCIKEKMFDIYQINQLLFNYKLNTLSY